MRRYSTEFGRARSGRIGRSASAKELDAKAVELAVVAHVRHVHTQYERVLALGVERHQARLEVSSVVKERLNTWAAPHEHDQDFRLC